MEELNKLFEQHFGNQPTFIQKLKGAGSNRTYYRLSDGKNTAIGVEGESNIENKAFIDLAHHFSNQILPTPKVFAYTDDYRFYIQQDLGDVSLFDYVANGIKTGNFSPDEKKMLFKTIELLACIQFDGARGLDFSVCYPQAEFDRNTVMWDLNYFKYCFLKSTGVEFLEPVLEEDFQQLADDLLNDKTKVFLYRDFQARNVMIKDGHPFFIDFQGGRKGSIYYDVASFVWQAKANYPAELKEELIGHYLQTLQAYIGIDEAIFRERLNLFVFFRTLQVLGAYGFRGYFEKKPHFIESIPFAIKNLKELLASGKFSVYPHLEKVLQAMCALPQFAPQEKELTTKLTVTIYSFSFKKGIPEDKSGNGGGYVFDCRGMDNPGRYEEYKKLTGLDKPVIDFLEKKGEITSFLDSAYKLADNHVSDFLKRGFTHLMFCFGCTGGQHRSVYSAQHLAEYLASKYDVKVKLQHREQNIYQEFN